MLTWKAKPRDMTFISAKAPSKFAKTLSILNADQCPTDRPEFFSQRYTFKVVYTFERVKVKPPQQKQICCHASKLYRSHIFCTGCLLVSFKGLC